MYYLRQRQRGMKALRANQSLPPTALVPPKLPRTPPCPSNDTPILPGTITGQGLAFTAW